jgi:hypothetical protein
MAATLTHKGRTTIWWAADNIGADAGSNSKLAAASCLSASFKPITTRVKAAGSTGATQKTVTIEDGESGDVTFLFETNNSNVVFPGIGTTVSLKKPGQANASNYECTDVQIDATNTDHAKIKLTVERYYDITYN